MAVIKDVAKLAGVSTGTVSKYFNNPAGLKEETRLKVEKAVKALKYKPSPLARSMRTGKTNTIGVIVPDITNPFFAEVYNSIRLAALQNEYTTILYTTEDSLDIFKKYLSTLSIRQVDGIVLCFLDENDTIEKFIKGLQSNIPIVSLSGDISHTDVSSVVIDVFEGIYNSTKHLLSLGHENIAYIGGHEHSKISKEKFNGYMKALRESGLEMNSRYVFHGDYSLQCGYKAARKFTMLPEAPSAIVGANDIIALGSIKYFLQKNIRVPEDVAVIGFDNISLSLMYEPALSTISLPIEQMGHEAIKLLVSKINSPSLKNKQIILNTKLIIRKSTDINAPVEFDL